MTKIPHIAVLFAFAGATALAQQVLVLTNGDQIHGRYAGGSSDTVRFVDERGNEHRFRIDEIQSMIFNSQPPPESSANRSNEPPPEPAPSYDDPDDRSGQWTQSAVIPAGTEIVVRTIDRIETRSADPHRHYLASIDRDVSDANGQILIPRGSSAHLIVDDAGNGDIALDLRSVRVN